MIKTDDEMAIISELVLGYREGRLPDIIQAIARFKHKALKYEQNKNVSELFEACDTISEMVENIRRDV